MNALETYYHATMQSFEQEARQKNETLSRIRTISRKEKRNILQERSHRLDEWFVVDRIYEHPSIATRYDNYNAFIHFLSQFPLHECFRLPIQLGEQFPCPLLPGNIGWIHRNPDGHIRYYSRYKKELSIAFDLLDLVEITKGLSTVEALYLLASKMGVTIAEESTSKGLRKLYHQNVGRYQNVMQRAEKATVDFLTPLEDVYAELQMVASSRADDSIGNQHIFFASTRFLAGRIGEISHATVARILNTLDALGLINRLDEKDIPDVCLIRSRSWMFHMGYQHTVSYFTLPNLDDVEGTLHERIELIKENGWNYGHFTRNRTEELLAESVTYTKDEQWLLDSFKRNLMMRGFATQEMVASKAPFPKTKAMRLIKENWKTWLADEGCTYKRPSKEQQKQWKLKGMAHIAMKI